MNYYFILALLIALRFLGLLFPSSRLWGFNHIIFLDSQYSYIFYSLIGIGLIIPFVKPLVNIFNKLIDRIHYFLYESHLRLVYRLFVVICAGVLFISFRTPVHFLGDGYTILTNLGSESGTFIKWSEAGIMQLQLFIQSFLGEKSRDTALLTCRIISIFSGLCAIWFFILISRIISDNPIKRILALLCLVLSGALLMFFGYVENYPNLWIALPVFIFFSLSFIRHA